MFLSFSPSNVCVCFFFMYIISTTCARAGRWTNGQTNERTDEHHRRGTLCVFTVGGSVGGDGRHKDEKGRERETERERERMITCNRHDDSPVVVIVVVVRSRYNKNENKHAKKKENIYIEILVAYFSLVSSFSYMDV